MPLPSLYPNWMINPFAAGAGGDGLTIELAAEPVIALDTNPVSVEVVSPVVTIEVVDPPTVEVNE